MKLSSTGIILTCEKATNQGLFSISPEEAFYKSGGSIDKFESKDVVYTAELRWDIDGTYAACPECYNELESYDKYCGECGEEVRVHEFYKSEAEAHKSPNKNIGIVDRVTFRASGKPVTPEELELMG